MSKRSSIVVLHRRITGNGQTAGLRKTSKCVRPGIMWYTVGGLVSKVVEVVDIVNKQLPRKFLAIAPMSGTKAQVLPCFLKAHAKTDTVL